MHGIKFPDLNIFSGNIQREVSTFEFVNATI